MSQGVVNSKREHCRVIGAQDNVRYLGGAKSPRFSICVMLTSWEEYRSCIKTFEHCGFDKSKCEFLVVDNSTGNHLNAYQSINAFLLASLGEYILVAHQDVRLISDGIQQLEECIADLELKDPYWAVCGNAGQMDDGWPCICVSHPSNNADIVGEFPSRVISLDENFLIIKREANLAVSRDLDGFHHYGADLCLIADILGWNAYVIRFFLQHNSAGTIDSRYEISNHAIAAKYRRAFRPRWIHLITRYSFFISGHSYQQRIAKIWRYVGKIFGFVPRKIHLDDPQRRLRRDRNRKMSANH